MSDLIGDLGSMLGVNTNLATKSTSRSNNYDLSMEDFLNLMIVQLTSQTIDDTMDTNEMMNQMVQMQMVSAITTLNETSIQTYANSLVGQDVTVGIVNGDKLEERVIRVMGTGTYSGQQVIFGSDGNMYYLSQIMAVGVLPDENGSYDYLKPGSDSTDDQPKDDDTTVDGPNETPNEEGSGDNTVETASYRYTGETTVAAQAVNNSYDGTQGVPTDTE